jgi:diguanylate cyclase (GGDEF)-like protein
MPDDRAATPENTLATVVDEHLRWIGQWHRAAFFAGEGGRKPGGAVAMPTAFAHWVQTAAAGDLAGQPAIDRLVQLPEQMQRMARLVLMRALEGQPLSPQAYDAVIERYDEFMAQLRRFERAFSVASSGIDPLTGLRTRAGMLEELEAELNRFRRTGQPFCVAICDLDHFKSVNDGYGHDIGDRVLVAAAGIINRGIRSFDEAFRMGGEEILILLKDAPVMDAFIVLERLRADLAASPLTIPGNRTLRVTASFGVVEASAESSVLGMLKSADEALYQAKSEGRNRVVRAAL